MLAIIVPAFNEAKNLPLLLEKLATFNNEISEVLNVVVVNNGSTDNSGKVLEVLMEQYDFLKVVTLEPNRHFGGAVKAGLNSIDADKYCYIPGDNQVRVKDIKLLYENFNSNYDIVKGLRVERLDKGINRYVSILYYYISTVLYSNRKIKDINALPKFFNHKFKKLVVDIPIDNFSFEGGFTLLANKYKMKVLEIPVTFYARESGESSWRKARLHTYFKTFKEMLYLRKYYKKF